jgi:arginine deiminase
VTCVPNSTGRPHKVLLCPPACFSFQPVTTVNARLEALGLEVIAPEITRLLRGGGGPHCMTFPLLRDL